MSHTFVDNTRLPAKGSASSGKGGGFAGAIVSEYKDAADMELPTLDWVVLGWD